MDVNTRKFSYILTVPGTYDYFCLYHAAEMRGIIKVSSLENLHISSFSISRSKNGNPLLTWNTTGKDNIAYLSVQRSYTGTDFTEIKRNSGFENSGKYADTGYIRNRFAYYLIESVTKDSAHSQTFIKEFIDKEPEKLILALTPNPVTEQHLTLKFNGVMEGTMYLKILNENGTLIKTLQLYAQRGMNNAHVHLDKNIFKNGTYTLYCSLGDLKEALRFVISN